MSCSKLISSLDKINSRDGLQRGENGHIELSWSKDIRERILQFFYQLVRTKELVHLDMIYTKLIIDVLKEDITKEERDEYLSILYRMIPYTRDIVNGKGEYTLSYMMIACWAKLQYIIKNEKNGLKNEYEELLTKKDLTSSEQNIVYMFSDEFNVRMNQLSYLAFEQLLTYNIGDPHPIGSFKDIKYFINYWRDVWCDVLPEDKFMNFSLIRLIIQFTNSQLKNDIKIINVDKYRTYFSLFSKWIPREKSNKFGWMTKYFAIQYFSNDNWFETTKTPTQQVSAEKKALTHYRKVLSQANRYIDTTQIKQCSGNWSNIDFDKGVTSITISKQKHAFLNVKKNNQLRYPDNQDRIQCSENFKDYINKCKNGDAIMKGKRVSIYDFVKDAINTRNYRDDYNDYNDYNECDENEKITKDTINLQWKNNSGINSSFNKLIAMVDTSGSMGIDNNTPLYNAIGLGIRIAERSTLGKRILTFDACPRWFNLDDCPDFVSCVKKLENSPWGMNTNFYLALEKILEAYVEMNLHPDEVEKFGLVILSDMQIDETDADYKTGKTTMFEEIERRFSDRGMKSRFKTPYKVPYIVFWNLRKTNGFPTKSTTKNVAMISGYSPYLLNQFLNRGIEAFVEYNSWDIMKSTLQHSRYDKYDHVIKTVLDIK